MKTFIAGVVTGLILATVGFSGIFKMLDNGVAEVKHRSTQFAK